MYDPELATLFIFLPNGTEMSFNIYIETLYEDSEGGTIHFVMVKSGMKIEVQFYIYQLAGYAVSQ